MKTILIGCISLITTPKNAKTYITDDISISASQTNEAILKYMLKKLDSDGRKLDYFVGVCTPEVYPEDGTTRTYIKEKIDEFSAENGIALPEFIYFSTGDEISETTFDITLTRISDFVRSIARDGENVEIYLDIAGGPRNTVIFIQLLAKLLSFYEIPVHAYYADIMKENATIRNSDLSFRHLKILDAVNEFVSHGNASGLVDLFSNSENITVKPLLNSLADLSNSIQLCNLDFDFSLLKQNLDQFEKSTQNSNDVFVIKTMIPLIKKKFHLDYKDSSGVISIVRWCIENGLVQQALTIYNENIADLVVKNGILKYNKKKLDKAKIRSIEHQYHLTESAAIFNYMLKCVVKNMKESGDVVQFPKKNKGMTYKNLFANQTSNMNTTFLIASFYFDKKYLPDECSISIDTDLFHKMLLDICFVRNVRNIINHAAEQYNEEINNQYFNNSQICQYATFSEKKKFSPKCIVKDMMRAVNNYDEAIQQIC